LQLLSIRVEDVSSFVGFADMGPYAMFSEAGKLEHKLPVFFLVVPNRYLEAHPLLLDALRYGCLCVFAAIVSNLDSEQRGVVLSACAGPTSSKW
jgi:hypothetical protein